jgi:hypothetical protein
MPRQQTFLELQLSGSKVSVLKNYDRQFAHEVFERMDETARKQLADTFQIEDRYELASAVSDDDVWEELVERSREDWNRESFFIVRRTGLPSPENLYVSPDWPSAEKFARDLQTAA